MDPYRTLNVPRSADQAAIKQAYRKLAKMLHPDRNPGSARAEQRFKEVSQAYDLLSDPVKRARYDRGEIDAEGRPQQTFRGFEFADDPQSAAESIFGKMFGGAFGRGFGGPFGEGWDGRGQFRFDDLRREAARAASASARRPQRGGSPLPARGRLRTAALGGKQRLHLDGGRAVEVTVPPGAEHGSTLRLKGQGDRGSPGGAAGDALVEIAIRPHPCSRARVTTCTSNCRSACPKPSWARASRCRPSTARSGSPCRPAATAAHAEAPGPRHRAAGWPPRRPVRPAARGPAEAPDSNSRRGPGGATTTCDGTTSRGERSRGWCAAQRGHASAPRLGAGPPDRERPAHRLAGAGASDGRVVADPARSRSACAFCGTRSCT